MLSPSRTVTHGTDDKDVGSLTQFLIYPPELEEGTSSFCSSGRYISPEMQHQQALYRFISPLGDTWVYAPENRNRPDMAAGYPLGDGNSRHS